MCIFVCGLVNAEIYRTRVELNGSRVIMVLPALFSPRSCSQAVISALLGRDSAHAIKNVEKDKELSLSPSLPLLDFQVPLIALNLFSTPLFVLLSPFLLLSFHFLFGSRIRFLYTRIKKIPLLSLYIHTDI